MKQKEALTNIIEWGIDMGAGDYVDIDALKVAAEVLEKTMWIPCSERLPEELVPVNVTWVNRNPASYYEEIKDKPFTDTAIYTKGLWLWWSSTIEDTINEYGLRCGVTLREMIHKDIEIIAWMPLPEPYKEGESDGH